LYSNNDLYQLILITILIGILLINNALPVSVLL